MNIESTETYHFLCIFSVDYNVVKVQLLSHKNFCGKEKNISRCIKVNVYFGNLTLGIQFLQQIEQNRCSKLNGTKKLFFVFLIDKTPIKIITNEQVDCLRLCVVIRNISLKFLTVLVCFIEPVSQIDKKMLNTIF